METMPELDPGDIQVGSLLEIHEDALRNSAISVRLFDLVKAQDHSKRTEGNLEPKLAKAVTAFCQLPRMGFRLDARFSTKWFWL